MSMHVLDGTKPTGENWCSLGRSCYYQINEGTLTVRRYDEIVLEVPVEKTVYEVHCTRQYVNVFPFKRPENMRSLLLKLVGTPFESMRRSTEAYGLEIQQYHKKHKNECFAEVCEITGQGFAFYWTRKAKEGAKKYFVSGRLREDITPKEVLLLMPLMLDQGLPLWFLQDVLQNRLGLTEEINPPAILGLIPQMLDVGYPVEYLRRVMLKYLDVTEEAFALVLESAQVTGA